MSMEVHALGPGIVAEVQACGCGPVGLWGCGAFAPSVGERRARVPAASLPEHEHADSACSARSSTPCAPICRGCGRDGRSPTSRAATATAGGLGLTARSNGIPTRPTWRTRRLLGPHAFELPPRAPHLLGHLMPPTRRCPERLKQAIDGKNGVPYQKRSTSKGADQKLPEEGRKRTPDAPSAAHVHPLSGKKVHPDPTTSIGVGIARPKATRRSMSSRRTRSSRSSSTPRRWSGTCSGGATALMHREPFLATGG